MPMTNSTRSFDQRQLRACLGSFVTGVTVVTTVDSSGRWHGMTVNSFNSVSLDPPLVLWSHSVRSYSHAILDECRGFAINILAHDQIAISQRFASREADRFAETKIRVSDAGLPLVEGCVGYLECTKKAIYPGGDHSVILAHVDRIETSNRTPLVFGWGRYLSVRTDDILAEKAS